MNYHEFMKAIDERLSAMSEVEKNEWIHNLARTTKEKQRVKFLNSLTGEQGHCSVISVKKEMEDWCRKIEDQEIYFECSAYEVYGDSFWDRDYVYEYFDIFEIEKNLARAFQVAKDLLFQREYKQAFVLYDRLCSMSFIVEDRDTGEWHELELEELEEEKLVNLDLRQIALNFMYAKYQITEGEKRAAELYPYFLWDMCKNIKVEEIFTVGPEELKGIDLFMEEWILFLKNTVGDRAGDLLTEACMFQGGVSRLCEIAREVWAKHPLLYKDACEYLLNDKKELECEQLGLEAIRVLPENLIVRGEIADLIAEVAKQLGHKHVIKECYEAAFFAEATLNHYLRLFELPEYQSIVDKAAKYAQTLPENSIWGEYHKNKQMAVNILSEEHKKVIRFFNGEFDYIYEECKKNKTVLGWSNEFKGIAVPLFILLLDRSKKITKAGQQLIDRIKPRIGFRQNDTKSFTERFLSWKEKIVLTDEEYEKYITWLKKEVDKRVEAVVGGGYRKSYYKAAALITALGETLESNGEIQGKTLLIEHYKKRHYRKSAFKAELKMLN